MPLKRITPGAEAAMGMARVLPNSRCLRYALARLVITADPLVVLRP